MKAITTMKTPPEIFKIINVFVGILALKINVDLDLFRG